MDYHVMQCKRCGCKGFAAVRLRSYPFQPGKPLLVLARLTARGIHLTQVSRLLWRAADMLTYRYECQSCRILNLVSPLLDPDEHGCPVWHGQPGKDRKVFS